MNTNMETEDSAVSTVTRLRFGQPGNRDSIPIRTDFSLLQGIKTGYGANLRIQFHGYQGSYPTGRAGQNIQLTTHLHLVPRLQISGATPLSNMSFCGMHRNNFMYNDALTKFVTM